MVLKIDLTSEQPLYSQLRDQIIEGIALGSLKEGESLPSVRQMAEDLGINLHTVNKVYSILEQDGFLIMRQRKSAVVQKFPLRPDKSYLKKLPQQLKPIIAEVYCRQISEPEFIAICKEIYSSFKTEAGNES
jgi:DNA-binding transcriptional regulator YhcF (GntR family)